jgi:6-pyruvoyltetrahydropterin/6-carboxytetrahydropterin synthase
MSSYRVRVAKDYTVFAAAHFVTYDRDQSEPIHGHNYRAAVSIEGELDENHYVFNFVPLKRHLRTVCNQLDHHLLLPTGNPVITVEHDDTSYHIHQADKYYVIPVEDVVQLPIANTTAELLATWIGGQLVAWLRETGIGALTALEVEIEEVFGQTATFRQELR